MYIIKDLNHIRGITDGTSQALSTTQKSGVKRFALTTSIVIFLFICTILCSCHQTHGPKRFEMIAPDRSGIHFENKVTLSDTFNILHYMYFFNGGGIGIGDVNKDGLLDVYFGGNQVSSRLYLNKGNMKFEDITESSGTSTSGWATGVSMIDINNDGWLDIYVCRSGESHGPLRSNLLYINNSDGTFTEQAQQYGLADTSYSSQAAFLDFDRDGDLDLYLLNHTHQFVGANAPLPKKVHGEAKNTDKLYINNQGKNHPNVFTDISESAGITIEGFGLGVAVSDINQDGWPDIYVANDFISNDLLYINQQDGTFRNEIQTYLRHQSHNGMGCDISDLNNDGLNDIVVADMLPISNYRYQMMAMNTNEDMSSLSRNLGYQPQYTQNTLQLNRGMNHRDSAKGMYFSEIAPMAGIHRTGWSWSALCADLDNDGWRDLFFTNGYMRDITNKDFISYRKKRVRFTRQQTQDSLYFSLMTALPAVRLKNQLFRNKGDLTFTNVTESWSDFGTSLSNGAAIADFDLDGDLDILSSEINTTAALFENMSLNRSNNNYVKVHLHGDELNPYGLGAKLFIYHQGKLQYQEHYGVRGYYSSSLTPTHFGLGADSLVDSIKVVWPDAKTQILYDIKANTEIDLRHSLADSPPDNSTRIPTSLVQDISAIGFEYSHKENKFPSFKISRLLHQKKSNLGPGIALGDVNGNGLTDVFFGGAAETPGKLLLQHSDGFHAVQWPHQAEYEDMGCLFLDIDGDDDLDLYVVSGGNTFKTGSKFYQDRMYTNGGSGNFHEDTTLLPEIVSSGACVTAADFDQDGDLDLFVGGRITPENYPISPRSYLLLNDQGKFSDVTAEWGPGLRRIGMVTSALWTDYDNDDLIDLILVGEWMPFTIFRNTGKKFEQISPKIEGLTSTAGWWNSIVGADLDNDEDIDYIVGNYGLNSILQATQEYPVKIHFGDFDDNGTSEAVLTHFQRNPDGQMQEVPTHARGQLLDQMPALHKTYENHHVYASSSIESLIKDKSYESLSAHLFSSGTLLNSGDGQFIWVPLPNECQISPVMGLQAADLNEDGFRDLITVGNLYGQRVEYGRQDAGYGCLLVGLGNGSFNYAETHRNGGNTRALSSIFWGDNLMHIVTRNDGKASSFLTTPSSLPRKMTIPPDAVSGVEIMHNGMSRKIEIYRGQGYLSQVDAAYIPTIADSVLWYIN